MVFVLQSPAPLQLQCPDASGRLETKSEQLVFVSYYSELSATSSAVGGADTFIV